MDDRLDPNANMVLLRRAFALFGTGNEASASSLLTEDFIINLQGMPYQMHGREAWIRNVEVMTSAFPDLTVEIEDMFGGDDRVAARVTFRGTHTGAFQGLAPTGRAVIFGSVELYRFRDGLIAEEWIASDIPGLMAQLGAGGSGGAGGSD